MQVENDCDTFHARRALTGLRTRKKLRAKEDFPSSIPFVLAVAFLRLELLKLRAEFGNTLFGRFSSHRMSRLSVEA